ncbi:MAG: universal stress protein, partial [Prochlorococcus sp.]
HDPEAVAVLLNRAREQVEQAGLPCEVLERQGKPAFVICDVADELNVDLIVMGTRGVNLEGDSESTAARVIQLAPCPVLVVP